MPKGRAAELRGARYMDANKERRDEKRIDCA